MSIRIQEKTNYSTLFNTLPKRGNGASDLLSSINLTDYKNIKSGSYHKLLNAYYDQKADDAKKSADRKTEEATKKSTEKVKADTKDKTEDKPKTDEKVKTKEAKNYTSKGDYVSELLSGGTFSSSI